MRYDRPELAERLAADYVLGLMPQRARARFDRAIARDATLAALTAGWAERLKPLDDATADEPPPAWVWRAIEQRLEGVAPAGPRQRARIFTFWRGFTAVAVAACAAIVLYVAVNPATRPTVVAELAAKTGLSGWVATPHAGSVGLSLMRPGTSERERPRWLRAALLLAGGSKITGTVEPPAPPR